ncbi:MAG: 4-(cytidine 5'-diphospho)-2-C-methyl-D-erythritol kinase [Sedimentisphaerales bacterium]|jgi:4-diphosphocytidyl-2-C-methyl-D-erythritol kinase
MATSKQFTKTDDGLLVRAPGKINLSLLVVGKRPDGYHELETIMAKINWHDEILIELGKKKGIELICKGPYEVPEGKDNLVYRAAKLILGTAKRKIEAPGQRTGIKITLTKNIPAGTGLGSGSSDAAGTLMGINRFLKLGLSKKKLMKLAAKLGSDAAFFMGGPLAMCTGRGEKVQKLPKSEFRVFLIVPDVNVSTKRVYENYRHNSAEYKRLHREINGYVRKKRIDLVGELCANMLQESCFELNTKLRELKKGIEGTGIRPLCLSGSGSAMYCIIDKGNEEKIVTYQNKLARKFGCKSIILNNNSW